jgi:hypothetical protein
MVTSKKRWTKTATKLALTTAMSVFLDGCDPRSCRCRPGQRGTRGRLRDSSWMSNDDWAYAYRGCMAQHGQQEQPAECADINPKPSAGDPIGRSDARALIAC